MRVFLYFLIAVVLGCHSGVKPTPPTPLEQSRIRILDDRAGWFSDTIPIIRFNPPYIYGTWRLEAEACSGLTKPNWPKFYVAPISPLREDWAVGIYAPRSESIVLALGAESADWVVRHEILHWLAAPRNTKDHPADLFGRESRCGPIVNPPQQGS